MEEYIDKPTSTQRPDDLLVWSILSTILCCIVTGIVAIVYSSKVNTLWDSGDRAGAYDAARKAKIWNLVGLGLGILGAILGFVFMVVGANAIEQAGGLESFTEMMERYE